MSRITGALLTASFVVGFGPAPAGTSHAAESSAVTVSANVQVGDRIPGPEQKMHNFETPKMAVHPTDPQRLVAISGFTTPLPGGCRLHVSHDGGTTWEEQDLELPRESVCATPWQGTPKVDVAVDADGMMYVTAFLWEGWESEKGSLGIATSSDWGQSFSDWFEVPAIMGSAIAVDDNPESPHAGRIYVARPSDALVAYSDDKGATWSKSISGETDGLRLGANSPTVAVGPEGNVYVAFRAFWACFAGGLAVYVDPTACPIMVSRSTDGGNSFQLTTEAGVALHERAPVSTTGYTFSAPGGLLEDIGLAVAPNGDVLVAFNSLPVAPDPGCPPDAYHDSDVFLSRSTNQGQTWAARVRINDDPCDTARQRVPTVDVAPNGRVDVVFYDSRNNAIETEPRMVDVYYSNSDDGGQSFGPDRRVTDHSFAGTQTQIQSVDIGHSWRNALVSRDDGAVVAWADSRNTFEGSPDGEPAAAWRNGKVAGASDVISARLTIGGAPPWERPLSRVGAPDPYAASVVVSEEMFSFAETVVIASGEQFAEAVAAGPLARKGRGPLLLTPPEGLPRATKDEISRLGPPSTAYVVGDTGAVSETVEAELEALGVGTVRRLAGDDSYSAAAAIAAELGRPADATAVIVSGEQASWAAAAGSYASFLQRPVLFVEKGGVPAATTQALEQLGIEHTVVVGGPEVISDVVVAELDSAGFNPERVAGADLYATSSKLAEHGLGVPRRPVPVNVTYVASGSQWTDAATAAPAVAYRGGTLIVGDDDAASAAFLADHRASVDQVVLVGCDHEVRSVTGYALTGREPASCGWAVGQVSDLAAEATPPTEVNLSFSAVADGAGGVASDYVIKQSREPIDDEADFNAAKSLCGGVCAFRTDELGDDLRLSVVDLRPATTYHYAVRARGNAGRLGPISKDVAVNTAGATVRLGGHDRFATAVAISRDLFADGDAGAVVLTRADTFPDALAGGPLAVARDAPLLFTARERLHDAARAELQRVLPAGGTVYLLGGDAALAPAVADEVKALGYAVRRIAGPTRIETAIAVVTELGHPANLLVANGYRFPDALAAGPAAAKIAGGILLTEPGRRSAATEKYLASREGEILHAIGGSAVNPYAGNADHTLAGADRTETTRRVAEFFFDAPTYVGIARKGGSGTEGDPYFADALTGGVHIGLLRGPLLLTDSNRLDAQTEAYLCDNASSIVTGLVYGGERAISASAADAAAVRIAGRC